MTSPEPRPRARMTKLGPRLLRMPGARGNSLCSSIGCILPDGTVPVFVPRPPVYLEGYGMLAGDPPLGEPEAKQLEFILRDLSEAEPVQGELYVDDHGC